MDSESETLIDASKEATVAFVSPLDLFLLSALLGFGVYWFFIRRESAPKDDEFRRLSVVQPSLTRSESFEAGFISRMKKGGRNIAIFYGSQTGTAEEFAGRLMKDAQRYRMKALVLDPEECAMEDLPELVNINMSLAIFCLATYGEGDPTDNAQDFYEWLQNCDVELKGLKFAVFGLGNRTYEHYNSMGKYVDKRLEELGGERVYALGLGDDDANIEEDFVTWKEGFWPAVCQNLGVESSGDDLSFRSYSLKVYDQETLNRDIVYSGEVARIKSFQNQRPPYDSKNPYLSAVTVNRELHAGGDRSCMHIEFDITDSKIRYETGDHVAVYPVNDATIVEEIGRRVNVDLETVISLDNLDEESNKKHPFPCPTSYRTALTHYLDIMHPPRTNVINELIEYCSEDKDKEFLKMLSSPTPEGKKQYQEWVVDARRNILAVLEAVPSCMPAMDHLCELLPRLHARYYSIASSPKAHPNSIHVCAILVEYVSKANRNIRGVATSYLKNKLPSGDFTPRVPIYVRKSQFRLPFKVSHPVMLIGPGTGLAPFIGFIQDRAFHRKAGKTVGDTILYTGFRKKKEDYLYQKELEAWKNEGVLSQLHVAFSRDGPQKVYVQHLLKENKKSVWKLISQQGHIYVCGDARHMARDVQEAIVGIVEECGDKTHKEASNFVRGLMNKGRYSADVWS